VREHFEFIIRQRSEKIKKMKDSSLVKLPMMRKVPSEKRGMLENIVSKKTVTENSSPNAERFAKYIKKTEVIGKMSLKVGKPKKFFLQQC
jgi:hypothetical protein